MKNERKRVSTRLGAGLLAVTVVCAGLAITSVTATATQTVTSLETTRVQGVDVYATSAAAAISSHTGNATASVLVSGTSYADGLSAAALAGAVGGPVILTDPDALKGSTSLAIGQVNSTTAALHTVHIVGGTSAVGADVATALTDLGYQVSRHSGADRVATADAVATYIRTLMDFGTTTSSTGGTQTTVFLTTGRNFADAIAVSGLAFQGKHPILLVDTAADGTTPGTALSAGTKAVLDSAVNSIERVIILGGTAAVSAEVETEVGTILNGSLGTTAIQTTRVGGTDRYDTAKLLLELRAKATTNNGFGHSITDIILVNGTSHEDGMSAAAIAGAATTIGTLLTDGTGTLNATTSAAITGQASTVDTIRAVGRTADLSASEVVAADAAATTATATCTIKANEGDPTVVVTYSTAVVGAEGSQNSTDGTADGTGAGLTTNYKRNNVALATASETTVKTTTTAGDGDVVQLTEVAGYITIATVASIWVAPVPAIGDVFAVPGSTILDSGATNYVAGCSTTVADDTTRPTVTVDSFKIGATTGLLHFSEPIESFASTANTTASDSLTSTSSGTDTTFLVTSGGGNYYLFTHKDGSAFISGQVLTVDASEFNDLGLTALNMAADATATAATDTTAPTATASIASTTVTAATSGALGTTGTIIVKGLSTNVATGTLGELWSVQAIEGTAGATPVVSLYDSSNRKVVLAADFTSPTTASQPTPTKLCAAMDANASVAATLSCTVVAGNANSTAVWAATYLTGGAEAYLIDIQWSETMATDFATVGNYNVNADGSTSVDSDESVTEAARLAACDVTVVGQTFTAAGCANSTGANSYISGAMQIRYTTAAYTERLTAGTSNIHIAASAPADMKGNYASTSAAYVVTIN